MRTMELLWLVICIDKDFIWTTLKAIFSIFRFFVPSDSRFSNSCISAKYCPILTNHTSMEILFIPNKSQFQNKLPSWLVLWSRVTYIKTIQIYSANEVLAEQILVMFTHSFFSDGTTDIKPQSTQRHVELTKTRRIKLFNLNFSRTRTV